MRIQLTLNVSRLEFPDVEIVVGRLPYEGKNQLSSLRSENQGTHFLRREGDEILCIGVAPEAGLLGENSRPLRLRENPYLCAALARDTLISLCAKLGRPSPTYNPIRIPSSGESFLKTLPGIFQSPD